MANLQAMSLHHERVFNLVLGNLVEIAMTVSILVRRVLPSHCNN